MDSAIPERTSEGVQKWNFCFPLENVSGLKQGKTENLRVKSET